MIFRLERCRMKFAHIGDLHIGKRVHDFSMLEDQQYILSRILEWVHKEKPDVLILAGDENLCGTESGRSSDRRGCL